MVTTVTKVAATTSAMKSMKVTAALFLMKTVMSQISKIAFMKLSNTIAFNL